MELTKSEELEYVAREVEAFLKTLHVDFYPKTIQYGTDIIEMMRERAEELREKEGAK